MKWRHSIIYLALFLLIGGYFYTFEVVKKEHAEVAQKEARKVFHVKTDQIHAVEITSKDKKTVHLLKGTAWEIVEPIKTAVDKTACEDLLSTLADLETEREVTGAPGDLKPFGLQDPSLKIRLDLGEGHSEELLLGEKNPVGDGYYAALGDKKRVFLVAQHSWSGLDKGVDELRKRELFSFDPQQVTGVEVAWQDGATVTFARDEGGVGWKAPQAPDLKIKRSKVENVLEQLQWLRAQKFLSEDVNDLAAHGLDPCYATVRLQLGKDRSVQLRLAREGAEESGAQDKEGSHVEALSSDLPAVVQVSADILKELPRDARALEDRSLSDLKTDQVKEVLWQLGEARGDAVQTGENKWGFKKEGSEPKESKEALQVRSLLWDLGDGEYVKKIESPPERPASPHARIELRDAQKAMLALCWGKPSENQAEPVTVWIDRGEDHQVVQVDSELIQRIENDMDRLLHSEKK